MISVYVPCTSANCSIGFDTLGLALNWFAKFTFEESDTLKITGCKEEFCNKDNLVVQSFQKTCEYLKKELPSFHLHIESDIPFSRGLGSSSTCVVGGILACDAWFKAELNKMEILKIANDIEGHPDNVAPAIFGGACTSFMDKDMPRTSMISCANYHALAMIPDYPIETASARKVLPETIPYKQAVKQVANALNFVQGLSSGNELIFSASCHDFLHEPYRAKLLKEYPSIKEFCENISLACWISGSGSTMLAMSLDEDKLEQLKNFVENQYSHITCKKMEVSQKGAYVEYE